MAVKTKTSHSAWLVFEMIKDHTGPECKRIIGSQNKNKFVNNRAYVGCIQLTRVSLVEKAKSDSMYITFQMQEMGFPFFI